MMKPTYYSYSKRLLAYILLLSLLLQSCHNPSNPLPSQPPIPSSCQSHVEEKTDQSTKEEHTRQAFGKISQKIQELRSAFENIQAQIPSIDLQNAISHKDLQKRHQNLLGIKDDLEKQLTALDSLDYIDDTTRSSRKVLLNNTNQLLDNELELLLKEVHQKLANLPQQGTEHSGEPAPIASGNEKEEQSRREFGKISQKIQELRSAFETLQEEIHKINLTNAASHKDLDKHKQNLRGIKDDLTKHLIALDSLDHIDETTRASRKVLLNNTNQLLDNELEILLKEVHQKLANLPQQGTAHSGEPAHTVTSATSRKQQKSQEPRFSATSSASQNTTKYKSTKAQAPNAVDHQKQLEKISQEVPEAEKENLKKLLEELKANTEAKYRNASNLLHLAIQKENINIVNYLLQAGVDMHWVNQQGETALQTARKAKKATILQAVLKAIDIDTLNQKDRAGMTQLHRAVFQEDIRFMQSLLYIGVNLHSKNNEGKTALHIAAQKGNTQIIEALINQQSQIDPIDKQGGTPFHLAIYHGHLSVAKQLITLGADIKLKTSKGSNALHLAAGQGHVDIVEWLLQKSLNINEPNNTSKTPLHVAAAMGRLSVAKKLLHLNAAPHLQDQQGQTALHLAAQNNHIDVFTELIHDSDPTTMLDKAGQSPLDLAIQGGHFELLAQYYSTIIDHYKASKSTQTPPSHPFKHIKIEDCIAHIETYYATTASKEQAAGKDNAIFQHAVLPLLKTHLTTASAEVQASFIAYIEAGYPVYIDILQAYPVEAWVDNLLLRSIVETEKAHDKQQSLIKRLQQSVNDLSHAWKHPAEVTHFLFSLYDKQLTHQLSPATIETILFMVGELSQKDAFYCIEVQDTHWLLLLKHAWLLHHMPDANLWQKLIHKQDVASKRQLFYALLHSNYTPDTLKKVIKALQEEQHIDEAKDLLKFTAKYKIAEENLIQGLNHAYSLSTDQTLRACKQHIACEVLSQQLTKSSPTHGPPLYKNLSSLILLGCNYETIHAFIAHIFSPTAKAHFTRNASELKIALDLLTTYHPVVSICEDALQFLVQEKDPNKWESEIHRRVIEATFLDSHERSIEEITTYIAEKSPDTHFAGDTKALHTAYKKVCEAYENPTSLRDITIKTTKKSDDGSEDITEEHTISTPSGAIKSWSKSDIKQWTHAVKSSIQQRGASSVPQAEMIAVLKQAVYLEYGYYPRNTQIMTLLTALNHVENQGRLLQVNTGEGKSLIIAMLAVIHALQGKKVDIVTSSVELSIPEAERKRSFFNLFELTVGENSTKHKEEDDNSDDEADNSNDQAKQKQDKEDNDKKEVYQKDIIYGVSSDFQADILKTEFLGKDIRGDRGFGVVLVDEVDNLLFDERNASLKISSPTPGMNHLELLLATIWKYVNEVAKYFIEIEGKTYLITQDFKIENGKIQLFTDTPLEDCMQEIADQDAYIKQNVDSNLRAYLHKIEIPNHLKDFVNHQIPYWIDSAITGCKLQKEVHYDIVKGKIVPIDYANTGVLQISMVWSDGLAQMLQMKEGLLLEPENLSNNFISTAGFFKRYGTDIYGLTGTLGNNSTRSFFREVYDVDMATIPPYKKQSITCNEQSLYQCKELTAHISHTQPEWVEAIITSSVQKAKQGRAVLMLCQYIDQVKKLRDLFSKVYDTGKIFIYTGQEAFHKHHIDSGEIIIATNISGRGTDLKTSAKVEENGGMHVCLTFLPSSYRVELQNAGRTAREGKKGTAQLVLYHPDEAQTIEKLRQKRDEDETKRLEKAKHDVRDILFKDDLFTKFCALENEFFPPAAEQNKIDETHMLDAGWQQVLRTRLSPARSKELYEEAIKEKANAILEPIMERLIKEKYVQKHDYLTRYKKFDEIITQLRKDNPEESIRKTHEEHVFNDFCCQMKGQVSPDVLVAFQERRGAPSKIKPDKKFKGHERQGLEERWGFWLNKTLHESKSLYDRKSAVLSSFDDFARQIRDDAKQDRIVQNPYFYIARGLQLMEYEGDKKKNGDNGDNDDDRDDEDPRALFDKAIALDDTFSTQARYNRVAYMFSESDNKDSHDAAKKELEKAKELLEKVHRPNIVSIHALTGTGSKCPALAEHLQHQIDLISIQENYIGKALEVLQQAQAKEWNVEISSEESLKEALLNQPASGEPVPVLSPIFPSDLKPYKPAIKKANTHGLNKLFTIVEKKTIPWTAVLTVGLLGVAQIVAGICLAGLSGGMFGSTLISEGVSDIIAAAKAAISGAFSWAEWGIKKAVSIVTDLICMGITKLKEGCSKVANCVSRSAQNFKAGVGIAMKQVKLALTKEIPRACFQAAADYVLDKTVIASIQESIEKKVVQELTEALENNSFVQQGLDLDNAQDHNMWQQKFIHEGLLLLKEEESQWKRFAVDVAKGVASNKIQGFSAVMKCVEGSQAMIDLLTYTNQFVRKWEKTIKDKYEKELKTAKDKHEQQQKKATQQNTTTQQQASSSASSSQQYNTSSTFTDTKGAQIPTSRPEGYTTQRAAADPLRSRFDKKGPSKRKNIADSFADVITGKLTNNIQGKIFTPITSELINMGIEKMTAGATQSLQEAQEAYRQECHEYYIADEVQKAQRRAERKAAKDPQAAQTKPTDKDQKPVDPYIKAKIDQILAGKEGDISDLAGIAAQTKRPVYIYDAEGNLYDKIGEVHKKPLIKGEPLVEPIRLQHIVNPDGTGHWQSYDSTNPVTVTGKTNCMYDACASQMSAAEKEKTGIHTGADLRAKTVETFLDNPKLATELFQTADRLSYIKPDALKIGGNRYRINVGTTKDPSSSSHYRSQYVNDDGGNEIDYLEVGSYDKDGNFQLKKCEVIERGPGGIYLVRFAESDKSTIGVLLAPGDDVSKDIQGYGLEPGGPSTAEANQNKRIPKGTYNVKHHEGEKYKDVPLLYREEKDAVGNTLPDNVPIDRTILMHQGTHREHTIGCIVVGDKWIQDGVVHDEKGKVKFKDYKVSGDKTKTIMTETGSRTQGPSELKMEEIKSFLKERGYENVKVHIIDALEEEKPID